MLSLTTCETCDKLPFIPCGLIIWVNWSPLLLAGLVSSRSIIAASSQNPRMILFFLFQGNSYEADIVIKCTGLFPQTSLTETIFGIVRVSCQGGRTKPYMNLWPEPSPCQTRARGSRELKRGRFKLSQEAELITCPELVELPCGAFSVTAPANLLIRFYFIVPKGTVPSQEASLHKKFSRWWRHLCDHDVLLLCCCVPY